MLDLVDAGDEGLGRAREHVSRRERSLIFVIAVTYGATLLGCARSHDTIGQNGDHAGNGGAASNGGSGTDGQPGSAAGAGGSGVSGSAGGSAASGSSGGAESSAGECSATGGSVEVALCCVSVTDFPDTCLIGGCGCAPSNGHAVQSCSCPVGQCFQAGSGCVSR